MTHQVILWPHSVQFQTDDDILYHMWLLQDTERVGAYINALRDVCSATIDHPIKRGLDAGTGSGMWAIDMARVFPDAIIDAIDKEPTIINLAQKLASFWPNLEDRINLLNVDINRWQPKHQYDLIVTELQGGVGNSEGCIRAYRKLRKALSPGGILIPESVSVQIAPVNIDPIVQALKFAPGRNVSGYFSTYYLAYGLSPKDMVGNHAILDYIDTSNLRDEGYIKDFKFTAAADSRVTGFAVWFLQHLTKNVLFSNNLTNRETTWGQAYFPVRPYLVKEGQTIHLTFEEVCRETPLPSYRWASDGVEYSNEKTQVRER